MVLYGRAMDKELARVWGRLPRIRDAHRIGPLAEYAVENFLRTENVLRYKPELAARIDAREEIPAHSPEEVECRMGTVAEMVKILGRVNGLRAAAGKPPITMAHLDYPAWIG